MHPDVTERDLEPVRELILGLIEDVRRQEREKQQLMAVATWTNAFASFKRVRRNIGLPANGLQKLGYGAILAALKATGKMLLHEMHRGEVKPMIIGISLENFAACVEELQDDDRLLESGMLDADADLSAAETAFGLR